MEIKVGIKALSKLIPTSNNIEMAKAVEYDSKFEGGARVLVELPTNPNEIVEPKFIDGNVVGRMIDTAFDFVEEQEQEQEAESIHVEQKTSNEVKHEEKPISEPIKEEVKQILTNNPSVKRDEVEWDLSNKLELPVSENEVLEVGEDEDEDEDEDDGISFNFPDNDEDDNEINYSLI